MIWLLCIVILIFLIMLLFCMTRGYILAIVLLRALSRKHVSDFLKNEKSLLELIESMIKRLK